MSNDLVGKRLGKYQIQAEIGKGGMGRVYLGYDPMLDRRVAIKVLAPHLVWETSFVERFLREARSAARLKHANIVTIYDVGQTGDWYYIVMEYLEGYTLAQLIYRRGPLSSKQALPILRQVAAALDYAHGQGLVHRDVKPSNIVVNQAGQATLTDFGVARAAQESPLTMTGALVGTPQYMSPEQAQGEKLDHRTDIYSLGVVAYELLTGRAPFGATTPHAVLHQLIYDPPPPIRSRRPDLPETVDGVMARVLAKEPGERYDAARSFVDALEQALAGKRLPGGARSQAAMTPTVAMPLPSGPAPAQQPRPAPRPPKPEGAFRRVQPALDAAPVEAAQPEPAAHFSWVAWLLVTAVGWMLGWALGAFLSEPFAQAAGEVAGLFAAEVAGGAVSWGLLGIGLGFAQWLVLRRFLRRSGWWVVVTAVVLGVVGAFKWLQGPAMEQLLDPMVGTLEEMGWGAVGPVLGTGLAMVLEGASGLVLGAAQALVLRRRVAGAGRWPWANALAWALAALAIGVLFWLLGESVEEPGFWLFPALTGFSVSVVTAITMARLLRRTGEDPTLLV